jgi:hypothetical protein
MLNNQLPGQQGTSWTHPDKGELYAPEKGPKKSQTYQTYG